MISSTLLLGNGLNRTLPDGISWNALLKRLGDLGDSKSRDQIPSPILFEQIAAQKGALPHLRQSDMFKALKQSAAELIREKYGHPSKLHIKFADIPFDNIITTNFDECFENAFSNRELLLNPGQSRNILKPVMAVDGKPLYYAHGTVKWPKTICLGYEHYIALVTKIRNELYPKKDDDESDDRSHIIDVIQHKTKQSIWPELLFTSNVYIVGFDLGFSEIDFWWLLALRSAMFASNNRMDRYANQVKYYYVHTGDSASSVKISTLQSLGVEVKLVDADDYPTGYKEIAADITSDIDKHKPRRILTDNERSAGLS